MVTLPTVQPANVFGSYVQGQQARQQSDMNAMRMQGAQREQAMQAITALAAVYKGAETPEQFENGKAALRKVGLLGENEDFSVEEGLAVLRGFLPQEKMTEFERLAQGLSGDEVDRARRIKLGLEKSANAAGTNISIVNQGNEVDARPMADKPPKGFQRRWDAANQTWVDERIPGSEKADEADAAERKFRLAQQSYQNKAGIVDDNIDKAIKQLESGGRFVAGAGSLLSGLPESGARDFQATLDTVKANLGFEELQAMRDSSPTGGALGQVTEREIAYLQAIQGNLDSAQSPAQLMEVLQDIKSRRAEFRAEREKIMRGSTASPSIPPADLQNMSDAELMELERRLAEGQ